MDIQEFYNLNTTDIINGVLKLDNGLDLRSHKNIPLDEVLLISNAAEKSKYFDRKLEWLQSALSLAQNEKRKKKMIEKKIKDTKIKHDKGPFIYYVDTFQAFLTLPSMKSINLDKQKLPFSSPLPLALGFFDTPGGL